MAQRVMVRVTTFLAGRARSLQHLNAAAVFTTEIVKVGDVVVSLITKKRHLVLYAQFPRLLVPLESLGKIIQADQAHGHIAERDRKALPILDLLQLVMSTLVVGQGFVETVLRSEE